MKLFMVAIFTLSGNISAPCNETDNNKYFEILKTETKKDQLLPANKIIYKKVPTKTIKTNKKSN